MSGGYSVPHYESFGHWPLHCHRPRCFPDRLSSSFHWEHSGRNVIGKPTVIQHKGLRPRLRQQIHVFPNPTLTSTVTLPDDLITSPSTRSWEERIKKCVSVEKMDIISIVLHGRRPHELDRFCMHTSPELSRSVAPKIMRIGCVHASRRRERKGPPSINPKYIEMSERNRPVGWVSEVSMAIYCCYFPSTFLADPPSSARRDSRTRAQLRSLGYLAFYA